MYIRIPLRVRDTKRQLTFVGVSLKAIAKQSGELYPLHYSCNGDVDDRHNRSCVSYNTTTSNNCKFIY